MPRHKVKVPGAIYRNGRRWWWKVRLPGQDRVSQIALRPDGARYATTDRSVAEEIARRLWAQVALASGGDAAGEDVTVAGLAGVYLEYVRRTYRPTAGGWSEEYRVRPALRALVERFGSRPAADFGPLSLQELRRGLVAEGLARRSVNDRVNVLKRLFRWALSQELIPAGTFQALAAVEGLRRGRTDAREPEPIRPVAEAAVRVTMRYMPPTLAAMVELQMLTGMRSGELCILRPADVDTTGRAWLYRPAHHKTERHGHRRTVPIGPVGQRVLAPYLRCGPAVYCFSPAAAVQERGRQSAGRRAAGERYNAGSYRHAIRFAIVAARRAGEDVPDWHPHQLRHTAATRIRRQAGLDAARAVLGHRHLAVTDTYAEIDKALAVETALRYG